MISQHVNQNRLLGFILGVLASLIGVALSVYLLIVFSPHLTGTPVKASLLDSGVNGPLCPGDLITSTVAISIEGSMVIDLFGGTMGVDDAFALGNNQPGAIIKPGEEDAYQEMPLLWRVPDKPPGDYNYVDAHDPRGSNAATVFFLLPFTIDANCEE